MKKQITYVLPRSAWEGMVIHENNEPLVPLHETEKLKLGVVAKEYDVLFYVRTTIAEKLYRIATALPDGLALIVIEGYRTMQAQQDEWNRVFQKIKTQNPHETDVAIEQQVRLLVAPPAPLANHHCGGAVDVTLAYADGTLVDMGTPYISQASKEDRINFPMLASGINSIQTANRELLRNAMETEDFVWYPGEWWHYCWGDRMWAVYTHQKECVYGPAYLEN